MKKRRCSKEKMLSGSAILLALSALQAPVRAEVDMQRQENSDDNTAQADSGFADIVVTAQKRSESINKVPMSLNVASGDQLISRGVTDASQLVKMVPGFNFNSTSYGAPVYTIRGVGFQDSSLAAAPSVSVYVDEVPIPFSAETTGASLDLERVEVLKGPQGTLYGQNSTGGAINYIAAKPTDQLKAGVDGSYGRFNTTELSGFVSGPISDTLKFRAAARSMRSDDWQKSYTRTDSTGGANMLQGRAALEWQPADRLKISASVSGWRDHSKSQAQQAVAILSQTTAADLLPAFAASPLAPQNARAADWDPGKNYRRNNRFVSASIRADYELSNDITLTSISSYQSFKRLNPVDGDGTQYEAIYFVNSGRIKSVFQEVRLSGPLMSDGNWMLGANYSKDKTSDSSWLFVNDSSTRYVHDLLNENRQNVDNKAIYANANIPLFPGVSVAGGIRYTKTDRSYVGCSRDSGNGNSSAIFGVPVGACVTVTPDGSHDLVNQNLNQDNISWRASVNYEPNSGTLLYANVSRGYKAGSFPILSAISYQQLNPVTQESILAYEVGFKATLLDRTLRLNGAAFYYDYTNKQIRGKVFVPIFNNLETLVNVPKSHVMGFELSAAWQPIRGLTISPSITMVKSKIDGTFVNYTPSGTLGNFSGEPFPYTPKWSGNSDVEYKWSVSGGLNAFAGANASYQTKTFGGFGQLSDYNVKGYTLIDLRAGVEDPDGKWNVSLWGRNVTNKYYWTTADHFTDAITRYAGMPVTYGIRFGLRFN